MFCHNCGKQIDEDSIFCQFCGFKITKDNSSSDTDKKDGGDKGKTTKNKSRSSKDLLWDKFAEIYDSSGETRKEFIDLSSDAVWELNNRLGVNNFETFLQNNKDLLNKQPYKVIEALKSAFTACPIGGYWFWMAEAMLNEDNLKKPKEIGLNRFIEDWEELTKKNASSYMSDDLSQTMMIFIEWQQKQVIDSAETVKELPNEFIENLKTALLVQTFWGYVGGLTEAKYRK